MDPLFTEEQRNRRSREDILSLVKAMQEQYQKQETKIRGLEEKTKELEFLNAMLSDRLTLAHASSLAHPAKNMRTVMCS